MRRHVKKHAYAVFLKIAEPRNLRILQLGIYVALLWGGVNIFLEAPLSLLGVINDVLVKVLALFLMIGSIFGAVAVLPGIWWLERVGLISLATGLSMYLVMVIALQSSPVGVAVSAAFILTFIQRWIMIKGSQLAPREV